MLINHSDTCNPDKPWEILARCHVEQWNQYIQTGCVSQYFQEVVEPIHIGSKCSIMCVILPSTVDREFFVGRIFHQLNFRHYDHSMI